MKFEIQIPNTTDWFKDKVILLMWMLGGVLIGMHASQYDPAYLWGWIGFFGMVATVVLAFLWSLKDDKQQPIKPGHAIAWFVYTAMLGIGAGALYGWLGVAAVAFTIWMLIVRK